MRRLTLTFDNGPQAGSTDAVLSALGERNLRATFFMVGQRLLTRSGRETASRVRAQGHRIGNHTMTHGTPLGEDGELTRVEAEIGGAHRALGDVRGDDLLFRPNGRGSVGPHLLSKAAVDYLVGHRYTVVTWNCTVRDWEAPSHAWVRRAERAISLQEWTLLVLHDIHADAMQHLPSFLDSVLDDGIEVREDFPAGCVPIIDGVVQWSLQGTLMPAGEIRHTSPG